MSLTNTCSNSFGLTGLVDILLVNKDTHVIEEAYREHNHITEPFARWLMAGQLSSFNSTGQYHEKGITSLTERMQYIQHNPIGDLLGATPIKDYQVVESDCGTGEYGLYVLSEEVNVDHTTQIPPYFSATLDGLSDKKNSDFHTGGDNTPLVIYYGTGSTPNDGSYTMALDKSNARWGLPLHNPAYTTTFIKNSGAATIKSVVLGAVPGQRTDTKQPATITVAQSSPVIQAGWDNTWSGAASTQTTGSTVYTQTGGNRWISQYLISPFNRISLVGQRYGDGIYTRSTYITEGTSGSTASDSLGSYLSYFDLATKQFENNTANIASKLNTVTGEYYSTNTGSIANGVASGIVLGVGNGTTKALNITTSTYNTGTVTVRLYVQTDLRYNNTSALVTLPAISLTGLDHSSVLCVNSIPVIVPRRGAQKEEDSIDIFFSGGVSAVNTGIALYKLNIKIHDFRETGNVTKLTDTAHLTNYGCVAYLPWAIGQHSIMEGSTPYCQCLGAYDNGDYYLPFTHLLHGCSPHNWQLVTTTTSGLTPIACADEGYQPGMVMSNAYARQRDFVFGQDARRRTMLTTDEGYVPLVVNYHHRWATTMGSVISGVKLTTPVTKTENQILVIRYTYTFDIIPDPPNAPTQVTALAPTVDGYKKLLLTWNGDEVALSYQIQRTTGTTGADFSTGVITDIIGSAVTNEALDTGLLPYTDYVYRVAAKNSGGSSDWSYGTGRTSALTTKVSAPSFLITPEWSCTAETITPVWSWSDAIASQFFDTYKLEYKKTSDETWTSLTKTDVATLGAYTNTSHVLTGLDDETSYDFRLSASIPSAYYIAADVAKATSDVTTTHTLSTTAYPAPTLTNVTTRLYSYSSGTTGGNGTMVNHLYWPSTEGLTYTSTYTNTTSTVSVTIANTSGNNIGTPVLTTSLYADNRTAHFDLTASNPNNVTITEEYSLNSYMYARDYALNGGDARRPYVSTAINTSYATDPGYSNTDAPTVTWSTSGGAGSPNTKYEIFSDNETYTNRLHMGITSVYSDNNYSTPITGGSYYKLNGSLESFNCLQSLGSYITAPRKKVTSWRPIFNARFCYPYLSHMVTAENLITPSTGTNTFANTAYSSLPVWHADDITPTLSSSDTRSLNGLRLYCSLYGVNSTSYANATANVVTSPYEVTGTNATCVLLDEFYHDFADADDTPCTWNMTQDEVRPIASDKYSGDSVSGYYGYIVAWRLRSTSTPTTGRSTMPYESVTDNMSGYTNIVHSMLVVDMHTLNLFSDNSYFETLTN